MLRLRLKEGEWRAGAQAEVISFWLRLLQLLLLNSINYKSLQLQLNETRTSPSFTAIAAIAFG